MPKHRPRPKRPSQHATGRKAISFLDRFFTQLDWTFDGSSPSEDYGLDAQVEVFQAGEAEAYLFRVQSKATLKACPAGTNPHEYFEPSEFHYFVDLNAPLLVTRFHLADQTMLFRWVLGPQSFTPTPNKHRLTFLRQDRMEPDRPDRFLRGLAALRALERVWVGEPLCFQLEADLKSRWAVQRFLERYSALFGVAVGLDSSAPLELRMQPTKLHLDLPGILTLEEEYRAQGLDAALTALLSRVLELLNRPKLVFAATLGILAFGNSRPGDGFERVNARCVDGFDFDPILTALEDQTLPEQAQATLLTVLRLRYFSLNPRQRGRLLAVSRLEMQRDLSAATYFNHLNTLQAAGEHKELAQALDSLHRVQLPGESPRFWLEIAQIARVAWRPALCLEALSHIPEAQDAEAEYLRCWGNLRLGRYRQALEHAHALSDLSPKPAEVLLLSTYLSLLVEGLHIQDQPLSAQQTPPVGLDLHTFEEAVGYIASVDATHPHPWYVLSCETPKTPPFDEPEFYMAFSAMLSRSEDTMEPAVSWMLLRTVHAAPEDQPSLSVVLSSLLELALQTQGLEWVRTLLERVLEAGFNEGMVNALYQEVEEIHTHLLSHKRENQLQAQDGFLANPIFIPSLTWRKAHPSRS